MVQIIPGNGLDARYSAILCIVDEPKVFGAQVYALVPGERGEAPSLLFLRVKWADMEFIGKAMFAFINIEEDEAPKPLPGTP